MRSERHNRDRWPKSWTAGPYGVEFRPVHFSEDEIIEVPLAVGDLLVFDNHLPHGTVRNLSDQPRAVLYVQMFPAGDHEEAEANIGDHNAGIASPWWRWKSGRDRVESGPPATLNLHGRRL
jgi:ectoine hydroxylase-related dioxygenase (phytanoyl-CoA dioxygenase family)